MPDQHAVLSASSANRWLNCPPSALLNAIVPDKATSYAQEGSEAHLMCEVEIKKALGILVDDPHGTLQYYDKEMQECADDYRDYVMAQLAKAKETCQDPLICIEQKLDYSRWVPQGFGTGDCLIVSDGTMHVIDFKYGVGVKVPAQMNPQMLCYGLGALDTFGDLYTIDTVVLTIYQPRRAHIDTFTISKDALLKWAEEVLAPVAKLAAIGKGEFSVGDWCTFCKIKGSCHARAKVNMSLQNCEWMEAAALDPESVAKMLAEVDGLISWAEDFKKEALDMAIGGTAIPHYKLVEGRANRTYADSDEVATVVEKAGYDPYEKKIKTVTAMQKMLGKNEFNELLKDLIVKPQGKPTLVPESDPRPALNAMPEDDFKDEEE